jgi:hypothetical protein
VDPDHWRVEQSPQVKSLFGRPLRVLLGTWFISRDMEPTYLQEAELAMARFGEAASGVGKELRAFVDCGMLRETGVGRRVYFTPLPSPLWEIYRAMDHVYGIWVESDLTQ